ncbi:hypothetical protein N0V95_010053 [Ascochyta clinopodiicola]|nr:hypothetical protein N0V95_010053 [Ascochyta clinopodiicola]
MKSTKGKSTNLSEDTKRRGGEGGEKGVLESPSPAAPALVELATSTKPVLRKKTKSRDNKQRRKEGKASRDGDSESPQVLETGDTPRRSDKPDVFAGQIIVEAQKQSRTWEPENSKRLPSNDSTNASTSKQILEEYLLGLENFTDALDIIEDTFKRQLCSTRNNIENLKTHIAMG